MCIGRCERGGEGGKDGGAREGRVWRGVGYRRRKRHRQGAVVGAKREKVSKKSLFRKKLLQFFFPAKKKVAHVEFRIRVRVEFG